MHEVLGAAALYENRLIRYLVELMAKLGLERRDFVIFGSGPLFAHGLRQNLSDLDIVARGAVWQRVSEHGLPATGTINGAPLALFWDGQVQFSRGWISDDWDADTLIDSAEHIHGLPFARLADVLEYKQALRRPKDLQDIEDIEALLTSCPDGDADRGTGAEESDQNW
jgi:hypothetical protein